MASLAADRTPSPENTKHDEAVAQVISGHSGRPNVVYRLAGDAYLLVEYGEIALDLNLRFRVHALEEELKRQKLKGLKETIPGVRSLLIYYDPMELPLGKLLETLNSVEPSLCSPEKLEVPSRIVHLPIAYNDRWTREAIEKYMGSVRAEAPYLPSNMDFIAKCNGLDGMEQVITYHSATQHLVVGLGDVYLGAPCAVPLDPRYRLAAPKYNPARTWTPEGAVGIGGAYICIYPMESPGGYQLIGRTIPIWSTRRISPAFAEAPWLLRPFDRIQFEPVTEKELQEIRDALNSGRYQISIEEGMFSVRAYNEFLQTVSAEAERFKRRQQEAAALSMAGY